MILHGSIGLQMQRMVEQLQKDLTVILFVLSEMIREILKYWIIHNLVEQQTIRYLADIACMDLKDGVEIKITTTTFFRHLTRTYRQNSYSTIMWQIGRITKKESLRLETMKNRSHWEMIMAIRLLSQEMKNSVMMKTLSVQLH